MCTPLSTRTHTHHLHRFLRQHKRAEAKKVLSQLRGAENEDKVVAELAQLEVDLEAILHLPNATWLEVRARVGRGDAGGRLCAIGRAR